MLSRTILLLALCGLIVHIRAHEATTSTETLTGTVKWYNGERGYGFLTPDDGSEDIFVHRTEVQASDPLLIEGQRVSFEIEDGNRERVPQAINVRVVDSDTVADGDDEINRLYNE